MNQAPDQRKDEQQPEETPFWRAVLSVLQAGFGVQSPKNRQRDFQSRSIMPYVVAALLFTVVFVLVLVGVVSMVLPD